MWLAMSTERNIFHVIARTESLRHWKTLCEFMLRYVKMMRWLDLVWCSAAGYLGAYCCWCWYVKSRKRDDPALTKLG
jgi:hypothetical protein